VKTLSLKHAGLKKILQAQWFYLLLVIFLLIIVTQANNSKFLSLNNIRNVLSQISTLGIISAGVTVLIIAGNFDISIGSIIGFAGTMGCLALREGLPDIVAILICIVVATLCSLLNGALSVAFRAPPFIITLATSGIFTGLCLTIMNGGNVTIFGKMEYFANTYVFGVVPLIFLVSIVGYVVVGSMLRYMQFGRRVYAIGNNAHAAFLAGININQNKILFFLTSGIMTGIATVMLISRLGASQASTGAGYELQAIGAVIIGGVPIVGGRGDMLGTFVGVLLMGIIFNMLNLLRVNPYLQQIAYGLLILASIAISSIRTRMK